MIRVGVDAWNLPHDRRGIGRYLRALLHAFAHDFNDRIACTLIVPEWPAVFARKRYRAASNGLRLPVISRRSVDVSGLDLLWFPFNGVSWTRFAVPAIATLHDASPFVLPGYDEAARAPFREAARRCARIITDSNHAASELARALPFPSERIDVVPLGVAPPRATLPVTLDVAALEPFVLFVGEAEERKGLPMLARAVERVRAGGVACRLVAVGRIRPDAALPPETILLGHVDDSTLAALYCACAAFAYPSRYEGFGLPVLEAMSYGAPVVASSAAAIPEAGGDAARYVAPEDVDGWADALRALLVAPDAAAELRARGRVRAQTMTWRACAARTLAAMESVPLRT
jgi:glycosyltransferase involved in cell wall biosynthesis